MTAATVTCRTDGCTEQGVAKDAELPEPDSAVFCGECEQQITDVTPAAA